VKPVRFDYVCPGDIAGALQIARSEISSKFIAGGQSLGPLLNLRLVQPELLIDITGIDELKHIDESTDAITIGSCVTHADIEDGRVPDVTGGPLRGVAANIAYRAVRNRGTIGGSLAHADPAADWITALVALGAEAVIRSGRGERHIPVERLMTGVFETELATDELLSAVRIGRLSRTARWGYYKYCRKTGELAQAMAAYLYDPDRSVCRAVIGAAGGPPIVFGRAAALFSKDDAEEGSLDREGVRQALAARGMTDRVEQQIQVACLQRAIAQAQRQ
jgi:aerobic carbon-monoxide dehydrogenase medium subunit